MRIFALDPGPKESGWALLTHGNLTTGTSDNVPLLAELRRLVTLKAADLLAVEYVTHYGMPVGKDVFDTVFWCGRFVQQWSQRHKLIPRKTVVRELCGTAKAKDANVRQAIIDRYGGDAEALGGVRCPKCKGKGWYGTGRPRCPDCDGSKWLRPPGPLHKVRGHEWSALAVALVARDQL